jgi:undecaprenyl diphosphate synthase
VQLRFIGDRSRFSNKLQSVIADVEQLTQVCTGMTLLIAANYGGRWDIVQAMQKMMQQVEIGQLQVNDISETTLQPFLSTADVPPLDLFIRTGGETRVSNFLLWQIAYSELYFSESLWPDFDESKLMQAIEDYSGRQRRFGKTGDQVVMGEN